MNIEAHVDVEVCNRQAKRCCAGTNVDTENPGVGVEGVKDASGSCHDDLSVGADGEGRAIDRHPSDKDGDIDGLARPFADRVKGRNKCNQRLAATTLEICEAARGNNDRFNKHVGR